MHLYPQRRNVAAQVPEELKTVTHTTLSYGGTQKKKKKVTLTSVTVVCSEQGFHGAGGCGGSIGRALASKFNGFHDQRFESHPEHKKKLSEFFRVKMLC